MNSLRHQVTEMQNKQGFRRFSRQNMPKEDLIVIEELQNSLNTMSEQCNFSQLEEIIMNYVLLDDHTQISPDIHTVLKKKFIS